jgi:hypothetical protein
MFGLAGMAAAAFWLVMLLAPGESQACPRGDSASPDEKAAAAAVYEIAEEIIFVASAPPSRRAEQVDGFDCCGHCSGIDCSNGCCSTCSPAFLTFNPTLVPDYVLYAYLLPLQVGIVHRKPPPDFRPPRPFA